MAEVSWGSIEVIDGDNSVGTPITNLYPLNLDSALASQIKGRTGVQLGSKRDDDPALGVKCKGTWNGSINNRSVAVRIWETDA